MQIWMKLFQFVQIVPNVPSCFNYLNMIAADGICPNASNCMQISMKHMYITQIEMKLFEVPRAGLKGRGARGNFHWRAPMTYFVTS